MAEGRIVPTDPKNVVALHFISRTQIFLAGNYGPKHVGWGLGRPICSTPFRKAPEVGGISLLNLLTGPQTLNLAPPNPKPYSLNPKP